MVRYFKPKYLWILVVMNWIEFSQSLNYVLIICIKRLMKLRNVSLKSYWNDCDPWLMKVPESALLRKYISVAYRVNLMFMNVTSNFENDMFYFCRGWSFFFNDPPSIMSTNFLDSIYSYYRQLWHACPPLRLGNTVILHSLGLYIHPLLTSKFRRLIERSCK